MVNELGLFTKRDSFSAEFLRQFFGFRITADFTSSTSVREEDFIQTDGT